MIDADRVIAVIGKTEGNGGVNDYTRIIADRAFREVLVAKGSRSAERGQAGPDRVVRRHRRRAQPARHRSSPRCRPTRRRPTDEPRLTVGFAMSERLLPEDIGRVAMIEKVADAVKVAMERAGITDPADVHYVQTKTPLLTIHTIRDAKSRGQDGVDRAHPRVDGPLQRLHRARASRSRSARSSMPTDADVMHDRSLYSSVASCSSGVELDQAQVVVVGNARGVGGRYRIGHSVMQRRAGRRRHLGGHPGRRARPARAAAPDRPGRPAGQRVPQVRGLPGRPGAAAAATPCSTTPTCTGTGRSRPRVGGVTAAVTGDPAVFVSVSAAHQGPDGGGPVAAIVDLGADPTGYVPPLPLTCARSWLSGERRAVGSGAQAPGRGVLVAVGLPAGASTTRYSPVAKAFGGAVIGSTASASRACSGSSSPVNTCSQWWLPSIHSSVPSPDRRVAHHDLRDRPTPRW